MRLWTVTLVALLSLGLGACTRREPDSKRDTDSASRKAGRAAYDITQESKEAARKAGQELKKAGREAREGWNEAKRKDQAKGKAEPEK